VCGVPSVSSRVHMGEVPTRSAEAVPQGHLLASKGIGKAAWNLASGV
jgi:hypothetical protein